jgi:flagellar hook-basal body complex protein FliE
MMNNMSIDAVLKQAEAGVAGHKALGTSAGEGMEAFGDILKTAFKDVNALQNKASDSVTTYATGGNIELHQVMIALEKAETAMDLTMQVRNKVVSAYQEMMHLSV